MTVEVTDIVSGPYVGTGMTDTYAYGFRIDDASEIEVWEFLDEDDQDPTQLTWGPGNDFTLTGVGVDGGGTVIRTAGNLPSGRLWYLRAAYEATQLTSFPSQGRYFPLIHERALDKLTRLVQLLLDRVGRTIRFPDSYPGVIGISLGNPVANAYVGWDPTATKIESKTPPQLPDVYTLELDSGTTSFTVNFTHNASLIVFTSENDCTLTVPQQSGVELPEGFYVLVKNNGGGNVRVLTQGDDSLNGISLLQEPSLPATVFLEDLTSGVNSWAMFGNEWIPHLIMDDSLSAPPGVTPPVGSVYIPKPPSTGAWAGNDDNQFTIHVGSDGYEYLENYAGGINASEIGYVYRKNVDSRIELFYMDNLRNITQITSRGNSLAHAGEITPDTPVSHTVTAVQNGGTIVFNSASTGTVILPQQSSVTLSAGFKISAMNIGGGGVQFTRQGSDTINGVTLAEYPEDPTTVRLITAGSPNTWKVDGNKWFDAAYYIAAFVQAPPGTNPPVGTVLVIDPVVGTPTGAFAAWPWYFAIHIGGGVYNFSKMPNAWYCLKVDTNQAMLIDTVDSVYYDIN